MNEWLSDGTMGLLLDEFGHDPTGPSTSPVAYYRVRFTVKNFMHEPVDLHRISVQFLASDLTESVRKRLGDAAAAEVKPFENEINWSSSLDDPRASRVTYMLEPLGAGRFQSSGHFYFAEKDPSVSITLHREDKIVAGPFLVHLGEEIQGSSGSSRDANPAKVLKPTRFMYGYEGDFGRFKIADTAEAFSGETLVGKARAIELQDSPTGGAKVLKIEVTHYSVSRQPVYRGYVFIQAGFSGGRLVKEEDVSGTKDFTVFGSWVFD
jgi:hypothetical protein